MGILVWKEADCAVTDQTFGTNRLNAQNQIPKRPVNVVQNASGPSPAKVFSRLNRSTPHAMGAAAKLAHRMTLPAVESQNKTRSSGGGVINQVAV